MEFPHVRRLVATLSGLALVLSGTSSVARTLPNYDALQDAKPAGRAAAGFKPVNSSLKGARVAHKDSLTGSPTFIWTHPTAEQTKSRGEYAKMSPAKAALAQISAHAPLYGLSSFEAAGATVTNVSTNTQGVKVVTLAQESSGIEVFRQSLKVLLNKHNQVVAISGSLSKHGSAEIPKGKARFTVPATEAIAVAYKDLTGAALDRNLLTRVSDAKKGDKYSHYTLANYARPLEEGFVIPARAKQVYFPLPGKLVPAYYVEINTGRANSLDSDYFAYVISATDGQLLMRNNLTAHAEFSYRVFSDTTPPYTPHDGPIGSGGTPHPTGNPDGYQSPYVPANLITLESLPFSRNDPWLPDGATETTGNNVDAYADITEPDYFNPGDLRASVTAPGVFDRTIDFGIQPNANDEQIAAATTSLFFLNNWLHDWYYDAGFDEASGNAQHDNFGRGGVGGDRLHAQAQDHSGTDNANMRTPADGASPRMQMYLFAGPRNSRLTANAPAQVAGDYQGGVSSTFGPQTFEVTGDVVAALDAANTAGPSDRDGCTALTNAAEVNGKIAIIDRGTCGFVDKVTNAQNAGAIGVIIHDNVAGPTIDLGGDSTTITIPTLRVNLDDGNVLRSGLPALNVTLWRGPTAWIDGTIDNAIVAHEWGHYISNRLIGNASGLVNNQGRSMGEGWGDFTALLMMVRAEDINVPSNANWNGAYAAAGYATRADADSEFFGIRRGTYSSDQTKNALSFRHIMDGVALPTGVPFNGNTGLPNSQVHNSGEIWATMLWECYTSLLRAHPFQEAQDRMKSYLVNGYKLTPSAPTYLEARDAVIAAAYANDPADAERFWTAFAKRGAGVGAVAPDRYSTNHAGVVESFVVGSAIQIVSAEFIDDVEAGSCDLDGILDNGETGRIEVTVRNAGALPASASSVNLSSAFSGLEFGNGGQASFPAIPVFGTATVSIPVSLTGATGQQDVTIDIAARDAGQAIPGDITDSIILTTHFDERANSTNIEDVQITPSKLPWETEYDEALTPAAFSVVTFPDGNRTFYAENTASYADVRLISPELHVSETEPFVINFMHAWDFEDDYDGATVEISEDGGQTWVDIGDPIHNSVLETYPGNLNPLAGKPALSSYNPEFPGMLPATIDLGTAYAGKTVQVRFRVGTDESGGYTGWLLDDLEFNGITNTPFATIAAEDGVCVNPWPIANAGPDRSIAPGELVSLYGSAADPEGQPVTFSWAQTSGPAVTLAGADTLNPSFTAPQVTEATALVFTLTVSDGVKTATDSVTVTVALPNNPPTVNAGLDGVVEERAEYTLSGSASDADGDSLTYLWTQVSGTPVAVKDYTTPTATFIAPEVTLDEPLVFRLTVSDGIATANDTVTVTVTNANRAPIVSDTSVAFAAGTVTVTASAVDPDGDALSYSWEQTGGSTVAINGADTSAISFATPVPGSYEFTVTATDGSASASKAVPVTIIDGSLPVNSAPTVNAGIDATANAGDTVALSGSASDAEGDTLTFHWEQIGGTQVTLTGADTLTPSFTAPSTANGDTLGFILTVSDGTSTTSDVVRVVVAADPGANPSNTAPEVDAGESAIVAEGATVTLNGTATDADGDSLVIVWTQIGGTPVTLSDASSLTPTFTAPASSDPLTFLLMVSDGTATVVDVTSISVTEENVAPVATARAVLSGNQTSATLDGSASSDANGDALTYHWTQVSGPNATISGADQAVAVVNLPDLDDKTASFSFRLTVKDSAGAESSTTVQFAARNGGDSGGCSATGAGAPVGMIGLALLGLLRRRRLN
ncbi:myxosortase-dependent M36 family metallopeptidase MepA [Myxococcus xanthus]|uniref:myxosortase-dependent M36 family metallopeptidase MepA n=1 Tax=Myxococcus xanthus TaxID=34 RepID=UPI0019179620|nr:myxosortase-dependent M36 family metallopeptidase MepA [Myxococcus xanthus]QQR47858.1 myxosortase-dependent M36 family metallopeptidase MepA [Myxococcus xanthus]